jgi:hypothetical protein
MAKNLTRKGFALVSASSLVVAGFVAAPAFSAQSDTSFVSLTPKTGTEYTVLTGASQTFTMKANSASSITASGRDLKFSVTDADKKIDAYLLTTKAAADTSSTWSITKPDGTAGTGGVTIALQSALDAVVGDRIYITGLEKGTNAASSLNGFQTITAITNSAGSSTVTFSGVDGTADDSAAVVYKAADTRNATTGAYVVDTQDDGNTANEELVLVTGSAEDTTRTVTVRAWVDDNGNDVIDGTEYASPIRTVTFIEAEDVVLTATMDVPLIGASTITATVKTAPTLNGDQVLAADANAFAVGFTRQGIAGANYDPTASWDDDDKEYSFSIGSNATAVSALSQSGTAWNTLNTVVAGTYSATGYLKASTNKSATSYATVAAVVAADVKASVAATSNITPASSVTGASSAVVTVRKGTTTVDIVAKVYDADAVLVGAGIPVVATFSNITGTHKVNGTTAANTGTKTALTDANGSVTFSVVSTSAATSDRIDLKLTAQGVTGNSNDAEASFRVDWATATYEIFDLVDNGVAFGGSPVVDRSINKGGSYTFNFAVLDQWGQPIAAGHRLRMAATGRTVSTTFATLTNGRANYTISDGAITATAQAAIALDVTVEQADGTAELVTVDEFVSGENGAFAIDVLDETNVVNLNANASGNADDADAIANIDLVAQDLREKNIATPAPDQVVTLVGTVANSVTADVREGAVVTVSGDSAFLFQVGKRYAFGSLTFIADGSGAFEINVLSNKAVTDSVVTVTANGATKTRKVTFDAVGATTGTSLVIDAPASAAPGSTFKVTATLTDKWGNPVAVSTAGDVAVEYDGPGIVFGTLPNTTNAKGQLSFAVLLGANDKGSATITVKYDRNSDNDFTGTALPDLDIVVAKTVTVGASASGKVNVGSFNGKLVVYASGLNGARISWKVGGNWGSQVAASNYAIFNRPTPRAGVTVSVDIYVNGVKTLTKSVVTR